MTRSSARVSVTRDIAAPADVAWDLISDVTRMGEWSPETTSCQWEGDGGAEVGATFSGDNTSGSHSWTTKCVVTVCEPGRTFAFEARSLTADQEPPPGASRTPVVAALFVKNLAPPLQ